VTSSTFINAEALVPMIFAKISNTCIILRLGGSNYKFYTKIGGLLGVWERLIIIVADKVGYAGPPRIVSKDFIM